MIPRHPRYLGARVRDARDALLTSSFVVAETATRLRHDARLPATLAFRDLLERAEATGQLNVRRPDVELESRAWEVMERHADRALSFTDCVGAVTARDAAADAVFGLDADFAALGFALEPGPATRRSRRGA